MGSVLRVNPSLLREAATAQEDVGAFVSGMTTGQTMSVAATGMNGLLSGTACAAVGTVFDRVAGTVGGELSGHSAKLAAAADLYHRADEELGRRLKRLVQ